MRILTSVAALGAALVLVGCTSPPAGPGTGATTVTSTQTLTRPASPSTPQSSPALPKPFALAAINVPPRPPGEPLPKGEVDGSCPYLKAGLNIEPESTGINFADLEGNRVQRVTRLTTLKPIGCRFYFQDDYHPTGDILPVTYSSAVEAHNAMVVTAEAGSSAQGVPSFVPGVDGISFQTKLNAPDAAQDWAFAFAKGNIMVVVRTDQNKNLPADAEFIAKAIVNRF
jgi:hypothetical protein